MPAKWLLSSPPCHKCAPPAHGQGFVVYRIHACRWPQTAQTCLAVREPCSERTHTPRGQGEHTDANYLRNTKGSPEVDTAAVAASHPEGDAKDLERPRFHVMSRRGWTSDPCGPMFHDGRYHLFYQSLPDSADWSFGMAWGHAVSRDLVRWTHQPPALQPSPGSRDADGCFTGSALAVEGQGPVILYTGVRLRNNKEAGPPPDQGDDLGLPFFETQLCAAYAKSDDGVLREWAKAEGVMIETIPPEVRAKGTMTGWRDPIIFETPETSDSREYALMVGSGIKGQGGAVLVYRSQHINTGWRFVGLLCHASTEEHGSMWECPLLLPLPTAGPPSADLTSHQEGRSLQEVGAPWQPATDECSDCHSHAFITAPDAPVNPILYWVGRREGDTFAIGQAKGPYRFDLGNVVYAINGFQDPQSGRFIAWAWLQENGRHCEDEYSYSGCLTCPRELLIRNGRIVQRPLAEMSLLRDKDLWVHDAPLQLPTGQLLAFPKPSLPAMDMAFTLEKGTADSAGLFIRSWRKDQSGSVAILADWKANRIDALTDVYTLDSQTLEIRQQACPPDGLPEGEGPEGGSSKEGAMSRDSEPDPKRAGGKLDLHCGDSIRLRVLLDGSVCEVFTSIGSVLTCRINRGRSDPGGKCPDIGFMSVGGQAHASHVEVYSMQTCWDEDPQEQDSEPCRKRKLTPASELGDQEYTRDVGVCSKCGGLHRSGDCPADSCHKCTASD